MEKAQLLSLLERARRDQDTYLTARAVMMLQFRGYAATLTTQEKDTIIQCLENSRRGKGILGLEPGYELARWILICEYVFPETECRPTASDIRMIQEACDSYCADRRFLKQIASLVHMGKVLNIPINLNKLPPKKRKYVEKMAATLA